VFEARGNLRCTQCTRKFGWNSSGGMDKKGFNNVEDNGNHLHRNSTHSRELGLSSISNAPQMYTMHPLLTILITPLTIPSKLQSIMSLLSRPSSDTSMIVQMTLINPTRVLAGSY
jgi:hypothetical protein